MVYTFPPEVAHHIKHLVELRVQIILKDKVSIQEWPTLVLGKTNLINILKIIATTRSRNHGPPPGPAT